MPCHSLALCLRQSAKRAHEWTCKYGRVHAVDELLDRVGVGGPRDDPESCAGARVDRAAMSPVCDEISSDCPKPWPRGAVARQPNSMAVLERASEGLLCQLERDLPVPGPSSEIRDEVSSVSVVQRADGFGIAPKPAQGAFVAEMRVRAHQ